MSRFYIKVYTLLPEFLKRRINPLDYTIEAFVQSANDASGKKVILDAGAGETRFAHHFLRHFYVALDSGEGDSSWDYSRIQVQADVASVPIASERVDTVVHTQVLEHVATPEQVLREMYRVLRPGGQLYLTAPQGWHEHQQPHDYFRFTRYSLRLLLETAGFREISIEPLGGYFHYLGHRLTYVAKVLFQDRKGVVRVLLFPLELTTLFLFCFLSPIACYYLDRFDKKKEFTLGYKCLATKAVVSDDQESSVKEA